jgi:hypothetical protein
MELHPVEWAELEVIDLAMVKSPAGKAEQVEMARNVTHKQVFSTSSVTHGLDRAQVCQSRNLQPVAAY